MTVAEASRWWCELAWLGGDAAVPGVVLEAGPGGALTAVRPGVARADAGAAEILWGLTVPGLVNAHSHAFHRALRGRTQLADGGSFWTWRDRMYDVAARLRPDTYRPFAAAVFAEMALSGITTVGEFHYLHHDRGGGRYASDEFGEAIVAAASDAGIRLTLLDTCYLAGGIGRELDPVQRRFADGDVEAWLARVEELAAAVTGPTVRIGAAVHSVRAVPPPAIEAVAAWASGRLAPLHAHVSEQPAENAACLDAYGRTPTEVLADAGALGPHFVAVHATHLTAGDIALLGGSRAAVCLCPTTERDLADGIGPARRLRDAGSPLCLGSDSHAVIDLWEEARAVELDERLASGVRGLHPPASLLDAATAGGAGALGWPEGGRLEAGGLADFCTLRTDGVALAGTIEPGGGGAAAAAVFAGSAGEVTDVVVAGRRIVDGGVHVGLGPVGAQLSAALDEVMRPW